MSKYALMVTLLLTGCAAGQPANPDAADGVGWRKHPKAAAAQLEAPRGTSTERIATLYHDPRRILEAVAQRMGIKLRPHIPVPVILLESRTKLERMQTAAERQWGYRPETFANVYATAENRIYLIDDADFYEQHARTLDDALAHEFVHYLQASYLKDEFKSEWSEATAIAMQNWFRKAYMAPILMVSAAEPRGRVE